MITRAKISAVRANSFVIVEQFIVRANSFVIVEQFIVFFLVIRFLVIPGYSWSSNKRRIAGAALIRGQRLLTFLSQMRRLIKGGAYSSKYGICKR